MAAQTAVNENGEASPTGGPTAAGRNTTQEPPPQQKLKAGEKKKLAKKQELLSTKRLQLLDVMEKADKYRAMIPEYVLEAGKKAGAQALRPRRREARASSAPCRNWLTARWRSWRKRTSASSFRWNRRPPLAAEALPAEARPAVNFWDALEVCPHGSPASSPRAFLRTLQRLGLGCAKKRAVGVNVCQDRVRTVSGRVRACQATRDRVRIVSEPCQAVSGMFVSGRVRIVSGRACQAVSGSAVPRSTARPLPPKIAAYTLSRCPPQHPLLPVAAPQNLASAPHPSHSHPSKRPRATAAAPLEFYATP